MAASPLAALVPAALVTGASNGFRRRTGIVRSGSFFQAGLAPFLARFSTWRIRHAIMKRYFGL